MKLPRTVLPIQLNRIYDSLVIGAGSRRFDRRSIRSPIPGLDVLVLEANEYPGGRIRTIHYKDAYAEAGALVITEDEHETLTLLREMRLRFFY